MISLVRYFEDGTKASDAIQVDSTIMGSYMAVSGDASIAYAIDKTFTSNQQFSIYSFSQSILKTSFGTWRAFITTSTSQICWRISLR